MEVANLTEGEWSCYRGVKFNGERMVMLRRWSVQWWKTGLTEVVSLMEREWSCYRGGQFNRGDQFNGGGQFNGGRMVMLQRW